MTTSFDIQPSSLQAISDSFSWERVLKFAGIYRNLIRRQLIVYGSASLIMTLFILLPLGDIYQTSIYSLVGTVLPLLFYFAPLVFCKFGDFRPIVFMTPAKSSEKMAFYLLYFLVVVPVVVYLLPSIACVLVYKFPFLGSEALHDLIEISASSYPFGIISSAVQSAAIIMTCFYVILTAQNGRLVKGILTVFGALFLIAFFGAICGIVMARQNGLFDLFMQASSSPDDTMIQAGIDQIMTDIRLPLYILTGVLFFYDIFIIWLSYRKISRPQI